MLNPVLRTQQPNASAGFRIYALLQSMCMRTCHNEWRAPDVDRLLAPVLAGADHVGAVTQVHQSADHNLVVDCNLCSASTGA